MVLYYIEKYCIQSEVDKILITKNIIEKFTVPGSSLSGIPTSLRELGGLNLTGSLIINNNYKLTSDSDDFLRLTDVLTGNLSNLYVNNLDISGTLDVRQSISSSSQNISFTNLTGGVLKLDYINNMAGLKSLNGPLNINIPSTSKIEIPGNMDISGDFKFNNVKPILMKMIPIGISTSNNIDTGISYSVYSGIAFSGYNSDSPRTQATIIQFNTYKDSGGNWFISFTPARQTIYPSLGVRLTFFHKNFIGDEVVVSGLTAEDVVSGLTANSLPPPISPVARTGGGTGGGTDIPPAAPSITNTVPTTNGATINWTQPTNTGSTITGYRIIIDGSPTALPTNPAIIPSTVTSATVTGGLTPGVVANLVVQAIYGPPNSPSYVSSTPTSVTPIAGLIQPVPPSITNTVPTTNGATITWSQPTNTGSAITGYRIIIDGSPTALPTNPAIISSTVTSATVTGGLTPGVVANLVVQAIYGPPNSPSYVSSTSTSVTPIAAQSGNAGVPSVPLNVRANIVGTTATITWTKPTTFSSITGYRISGTKTSPSGIVSNLASTTNVNGADTLTGTITISRTTWDIFEISVAAVYTGGTTTIGPPSTIKLPILFPDTGTNDGTFLIYSQFFTTNEPARLLVDTDRPRNASGANTNGVYTLTIDYGQGPQDITDSNLLPNSTLVGDNALGGWPMPWTNNVLGIFDGKANGLKIAGSVQSGRDVSIKLIDRRGNTISASVPVYPIFTGDFGPP